MLSSQEIFDPDGDLVLVLTKPTENPKANATLSLGGISLTKTSSSASQPSSGLFGSFGTLVSPAVPSTTGLFGGLAASTQTTANTFGSPPQPMGGLFGSRPAASTQIATNTLGSSPQSTGGLFGSRPAASTQIATNTLGSSPQSTGSLFGGSPAASTQTATSTFGTSTSAIGTSTSGFGTPAVSQTTGGGPFVTSTRAQTNSPFGGSSATSLFSTPTPTISTSPGTSSDVVVRSSSGLFGTGNQSAPKAAASNESPLSTIRMLVSSKHMMLASPVFKAMLNGNFKEGRTLQTDGTVDIELPDDDVDAFRIILNVIHGRNRSVSSEISLDDLTKIAVVVDKYQMVEITESYSGRWIAALRSSMPKYHCSEVGKWICISWVFELASDFTAFTRIVMQGITGDVSDGFMDYIPLPQTIYNDINSRRQKAISALYEVIDTHIKSFMAPEVHCSRLDGKGKTCDALMLGNLLRSAKSTGTWPPKSPPYRFSAYSTVAVAVKSVKVESYCDVTNAAARFGDSTRESGHALNLTIAAQILSISDKHLTGLLLSEFGRGLK